MVSVRLNKEDEQKLEEIMVLIGIPEKSSVIRQLIHERWLASLPGITFLERMGQPPQYLLNGSPQLSSRKVRKQIVEESLSNRIRRRQGR